MRTETNLSRPFWAESQLRRRFDSLSSFAFRILKIISLRSVLAIRHVLQLALVRSEETHQFGLETSALYDIERER